MNILLDSRVLIWALSDDPRLSDKARGYIMDADNMIFYSAASFFPDYGEPCIVPV